MIVASILENKELMKQWTIESERHALSVCGFCGHDDYNYLRNKKFAEIILGECLKKARSEEDRFYGLNETDLALAMENYQEVLKQHFGLKD